MFGLFSNATWTKPSTKSKNRETSTCKIMGKFTDYTCYIKKNEKNGLIGFSFTDFYIN